MTDPAAGLLELAEPRPRGEKFNLGVERAARAAGLEYWRAFNIIYGKARRIEPHEHAAIADALDKKREEALRNEVHDLRLRLARLESLLVQRDPGFHREAPDQTRQSAGGLRGMGRAVGAKA